MSSMLTNLRRGDKIITHGGIIGTISKVADNRELTVEISENVEIKVAPGMVTDLYGIPEQDKKNIPANEKKDNKVSNEEKRMKKLNFCF